MYRPTMQFFLCQIPEKSDSERIRQIRRLLHCYIFVGYLKIRNYYQRFTLVMTNNMFYAILVR